MPTPEEEKALKKYVARVLEIQKQEDQKALSKEELHEMARSLGLTEADWQAVERSLNGHLTRGQGFLKFKNWGDALDEFRQCLTLMPQHGEAIQGLMHAHYGRWQEGHAEADYQAALRYGREYLRLFPDDEPTLRLVSTLSRAKDQKPASGNKKWQVLLAIGAFALLLIIGFLIFKQSPPKLEEEAPAPVPRVTEDNSSAENQNTAQEEESGQNTAQGENTPPPVVTPNNENERTPVVAFQNTQNADLIWQPFSSQWQRYAHNGATVYTLSGTLTSNAKITRRLTLDIVGFNTKNEEVFRETIKAVDKHDPPVRPDDLIPIGLHKYKEPGADIHQVVLAVSSVQQENSPSSFAESPVKAFTWQQSQPANANIEIRERKGGMSSSLGKENGFFKINLAIKNTGTVSLSGLKLEIDWFTPGSQTPIETKPMFVVGAHDPPLKPGETFLFGGTYYLKGIKNNEVEYRLRVVDVEE